jgi:hypothetical protein
MNKLWSARFWTFLMVILTLCITVLASVRAIFNTTGTIDPVVEKIAMFILGAFTSIATGMYKEYFDRADRKDKPDEKV